MGAASALEGFTRVASAVVGAASVLVLMDRASTGAISWTDGVHLPDLVEAGLELGLSRLLWGNVAPPPT